MRMEVELAVYFSSLGRIGHVGVWAPRGKLCAKVPGRAPAVCEGTGTSPLSSPTPPARPRWAQRGAWALQEPSPLRPSSENKTIKTIGASQLLNHLIPKSVL